MSSSVRAQEMAVQTGSSAQSIASMRSKDELVKCLLVSNIDADIIDDVVDTCELNGIDALTLAASILSPEQIEKLLYLTLEESQVLAQNCKVVAFENGVTFGATTAPAATTMRKTPVSSLHGKTSSLQPFDSFNNNSEDLELDFSTLVCDKYKLIEVPPVEDKVAAFDTTNAEDSEDSVGIMAGQDTSNSGVITTADTVATIEYQTPRPVDNIHAPVYKEVVAVTPPTDRKSEDLEDGFYSPTAPHDILQLATQVLASPALAEAYIEEAADEVAEPAVIMEDLVSDDSIGQENEPIEGDVVPMFRASQNGRLSVPMLDLTSIVTRAKLDCNDSPLESPHLPMCSNTMNAAPENGAHHVQRVPPHSLPSGAPIPFRPSALSPSKVIGPHPTTLTARTSFKPRAGSAVSATTRPFSAPVAQPVYTAVKRTTVSNVRSTTDVFEDSDAFLKYPVEMPGFLRPTVAHQNRMRHTTVDSQVEMPKKAAVVPKIRPMSNLVRATASSTARVDAAHDELERGSIALRSPRKDVASERMAREAHVTVQVPFRLRTSQRPVTTDLSSDERALKHAATALVEQRKQWSEQLKRAARPGARLSTRGPTKFELFNLTSLQLHEREVQGWQQRMLKEREAEIQARNFKAQPFDLQALALRYAKKRRTTAPPPVYRLTVPKGPSFQSDNRASYHQDVLEGRFRDTHAAYASSRKSKAEAKQAAIQEKAERIRRDHKFVARSMPDFSVPFYPDPSKVAPVTKPSAPHLLTSSRGCTTVLEPGSSSMSSPRLASPHGTSSSFAMSLRS